jgi:hypothetical protein
MYDYIPGYYEDIREARAIVDTESAILDLVNADINDVLAQFYVDTATWGLANWERICGISTDESKPIDQRRSVVKSKLRGIGTVTVGLIESVAESYSNGDVAVIEDNANYTVTIKFVSTLGVPPNMADIQNALREIIPAHLAINYEFTYATYSELTAKYATYTALATSGHTYDFILTDK